jgi:hypothetical protein
MAVSKLIPLPSLARNGNEESISRDQVVTCP